MNPVKDTFLTACGIFHYRFCLKGSAFLSPNELQKFQYRKLKKLLAAAGRHTAYYRMLFRKIGFDPQRDFRSMADLSRIPILSREEVRTHPELFLNERYRKRGIRLRTSGSTGEPLEVRVNARHWITEQAVIWRQWKRAGYRMRDKMAIVRSYAPRDGKPIRHDRLRNFRYYSPFRLDDLHIGLYLEDMRGEGVKFLRGYPSSVGTLADYVLKHRPPLPKLQAIFTASEVLTDENRRRMETAFGCPVFNHYGLAECIVMAGTWEPGSDLRFYPEYGYTELLKTEQPGLRKIVGTNLNNRAMPLIRYDTGDLAETGSEDGATGPAPVVRNIRGRADAVLRLAGRRIPLTNFYTLLENYPSLESWQIVRLCDTKIELRFSGTLASEEEQEIRHGFALRLPEGTVLSLRSGFPFIRTGEGKKNPFVSVASDTETGSALSDRKAPRPARLCIDMHTHSCRSADCDTTVEEIVRQGTKRGLTHIVVADHNRCGLSDAETAEARKAGIILLRAIEFTTEEGVHLIGIHPRIGDLEKPARHYPLRELAELLTRFGAILLIPHPSDPTGLTGNGSIPPETVHAVLSAAHFIETDNRNHGKTAGMAEIIARYPDLTPVVGSDAHSPNAVGAYRNIAFLSTMPGQEYETLRLLHGSSVFFDCDRSRWPVFMRKLKKTAVCRRALRHLPPRFKALLKHRFNC